MEVDNNHFPSAEVSVVSTTILNLTKPMVKVDLGYT